MSASNAKVILDALRIGLSIADFLRAQNVDLSEVIAAQKASGGSLTEADLAEFARQADAALADSQAAINEARSG